MVDLEAFACGKPGGATNAGGVPEVIDTGVVIVPHDRAEEILKIAKEIDEVEQSILKMLDKGMTMREARKQTGYHKLQTKR